MKRFALALPVVMLLVCSFEGVSNADSPWYGSYAYGGSYTNHGCSHPSYHTTYRVQPNYVVRNYGYVPYGYGDYGYAPYSYGTRVTYGGSHPYHRDHYHTRYTTPNRSGISLYFGY